MDSRADKAARLYSKYSRLLLKIAYDSTDDPQLAEDAVSETYEKVIRRIDYIDESNEKRTGALLILMCKQTVAELYRQKNKSIGIPLADPPLGATDKDDVISEVLKQNTPHEIRKKLSWLSPKYLEPFLLHYLDEIPIPDIAKKLGITEDNVYTLLYRARKKLRERYGNGGNLF